MHLHRTMSGRIFFLGEDDPERPGYIACLDDAAMTAERLVDTMQQLYATGWRGVEAICRVIEAAQAANSSLVCVDLGRVPASRMGEAQAYFVRAWASEQALLNDWAQFMRMPTQSTQAGDPREGFAYIVAAWDPRLRLCRKIGWTGKSPGKWLRNAAEYAARDLYRGHRSPNREWLAPFERKDPRVRGYPLVSVLDTVQRGEKDGNAKAAAETWRQRFGLEED
jgi:hypothetical protein